MENATHKTRVKIGLYGIKFFLFGLNLEKAVQQSSPKIVLPKFW